MPSHRELSAAEEDEFEKGGGLKKKTLEDRAREGVAFYEFFDSKAEGEKIEDLVKTELGRETLSKIVSSYFFSMEVEGGERPKKNYANKIRSHIKCHILEEKKFDITDPALFPRAAKRWKSFMNTLAKEGRADTTHKEEIPSETLEKIYELLNNVKDALENRGVEDYIETYLSRIPTEFHIDLHRLLQYGAALVLNFYEVRRGVENLDALKASAFKVIEDQNFVFKYIKKVLSEQDKNHPGGTNVRCNGVIPFMVVEGSDENQFNPGCFFQFYLSFLPLAATKDHLDGGWLFPRPRKHGQGSLNIHKEGEMDLFEPNMKVGPRTMPGMLPALCEAVGQPRCTNHQIRTTAIIYMRRAGIPWLTIAKITGHQSVENLIKYYDLNLEAAGLADVVGALAQGPGVATGGAHEKIVLESRQPKKKKIKMEGGKEADSGEKATTQEFKENVPPGNTQPASSSLQSPFYQLPCNLGLPPNPRQPQYQYPPSYYQQPYQVAHQQPPYQFSPYHPPLFQQLPPSQTTPYMAHPFQPPGYQLPGYQLPPNQQPSYQLPPNQQPPYQLHPNQQPPYQLPPIQQSPYQQPLYQPSPYQPPPYQPPHYQPPHYQSSSYHQAPFQNPHHQSHSYPVSAHQYQVPVHGVAQSSIPMGPTAAQPPNFHVQSSLPRNTPGNGDTSVKK